MYDDAGGADPAPMGGGMPRFNLEGLIPLILLVIIGIASLNYFGVVDIPYLPKGSDHVQLLFIGEPSLGEKVVLDNLSYMLTYRIRDARTFGIGASEELSQYSMVILDQSLTDKSVSVSLGEALENYVNKGGKLIVVQNSGIYQSVGLGGSVATDVVGWKATFGNVMPAECVLGPTNVPTCAEGQEINVAGRIRRELFNHPIMSGIELTPPEGQQPYQLRTFNIQANEGAKRIAYVQSEGTPMTYPAILEKKSFPFGTVIYFNYDPGYTPGILTNTIKYLQ
ncbi:MAG: hypothetical protein PHP82_03770 [Candidatus ainarchaeum sp.]|nr:hypothetical protein [Candidatus ainarchaeum sp.]